MSNGIHDIVIEEVDFLEGTFKGYCYSEGAPLALRQVLEIGTGFKGPIELRGTFEIEWDEDYPCGVTIDRTWLSRTYRPHTKPPVPISIEAYDVFAEAGDRLSDVVFDKLDRDGASADRAGSLIDAVYDSMRDDGY